MSSRALTLILALTVAFSAATLIDRATAKPAGPVCCICACGSENSTTFQAAPGGAVCRDAASGGECGSLCGDLGCGVELVGNQSCTSPAFASGCGVTTMAPASSSTGLVALIAALTGFGAFYLRRRSLRD